MAVALRAGADAASGSAKDVSERRRCAFDELGEALEDISVRTIAAFRDCPEVTAPVEAVAAAIVCIIARIDDTVELTQGDSMPPRTWQAAQTAMAKPGYFINSLRRFPYAVDSGRVPEENVRGASVAAAVQLTPKEVEAFPMAVNLHRWLLSAIRYWDVYQDLQRERFKTYNETLQRTVAPPQQDTILTSSANARLERAGFDVGANKVAGYPASNTQIDLPNQMSLSQPDATNLASAQAAENRVTRPRAPGTAPRSNKPMAPEKQGDRSTGRSASGGAPSVSANKGVVASKSVPAMQTQLDTNGRTANKPQLDQNRERTARPAASASRSPNPSSRQIVSTRTPPRTPPQTPPRTPNSGHRQIVSPGRGGSWRPLSMEDGIQPRLEDWQQMLEKTKKEIRDVRGAEARMKCSMAREEKKERDTLAKAAITEIREWRAKQDSLSKEQAFKRALDRRKQELQENREFQDFKKTRKARPVQEDMCATQAEYIEVTEQSRWNVDLKRAAEEEKRNMVVAHFEKYDHMRALKAETAANNRAMEDDERIHERQLEMDYKLKELNATRQRMLQSMEYTRGRQHVSLNQQRPLFPEPDRYDIVT